MRPGRPLAYLAGLSEFGGGVLTVLVRQCLKRRLPDTQALEREAGAWCEERNRSGTSVDWRFTTEDARIKLRKFYPSIDT